MRQFYSTLRKTISKIGNKQTWFTALALLLFLYGFIFEVKFYPFLFICVITVALGASSLVLKRYSNDLIPQNKMNRVASKYLEFGALLTKLRLH